MTIQRISTPNLRETAAQRLAERQAQLADLQEQVNTGKKINRLSDDPLAAAQAERATTRVARVETQQRALQAQKASMTSVESTLGDSVTTLQTFRSLLVQAGGGALSAADRKSIAQQMTALRDQLLSYANTANADGLPLFGGLGSTARPFTDAGGTVSYQGVSGQAAPSDTGVPGVLDGYATWMDVPTGNGVFEVNQGGSTTQVHTDTGQVLDPSALTGHDYQVKFSVGADGSATYDVLDTTTQQAVVSGAAYKSGQAIQFGGLSFTASGSPADGDTLNVKPSTTQSVFAVMDQAIAGVLDGSAGRTTQAVSRGLAQVDAGLAKLSAARSQAGELLNRADTIGDRLTTRGDQLEKVRADAEDADTVQVLSDITSQQTMYSAALGTYAQIQKLSLFNYLG
ncbi:flagellar hook-associated protein FlgL [uncultured Pseudacidovorax sp.]|uniref:flagellar hook-associated protein FlgL n=1 Tax=uncultured Pseudacidovorax sp. TaxID=679313 RepID=UPI0025E8E066|nr:flagellar hook-associated protein FlgL [uncultured Pseudacidovorax sp.]